MSTIHKIILLTIAGILIMSAPALGQKESVSLGNFYVPAKGSIAIFSKHNFQDVGIGLLPGIIATDRSENRGHVIFSKTSTWQNANDISHVDGYVKSVKTGPFLFPTGDNNRFGPIGVSEALDVEAAYFAVDPSYAVTSIVLSNEYTTITEAGPFAVDIMSESVGQVSDREYWHLKGERETKITLSWSGHSKIEDLTNSELKSLTIMGWDGTEWVAIPSLLDEYSIDRGSSGLIATDDRSSFRSGSITTEVAIVPNAYHVYTLGRLSDYSDDDQSFVSVYPNPVKAGGFVNVNYGLKAGGKSTLRIFNSSNQLILTKNLNGKGGKLEIPLDDYRRGVFNMSITDENGHTVYKKLIVVDL